MYETGLTPIKISYKVWIKISHLLAAECNAQAITNLKLLKEYNISYRYSEQYMEYIQIFFYSKEARSWFLLRFFDEINSEKSKT